MKISSADFRYWIWWQVSLLLVRHGADVDVEDKEGYTALGRAPKDLQDAIIDAAKAMMEG